MEATIIEASNASGSVLHSSFPEWGFSELARSMDSTIKKDDICKTVLYLQGISTYTDSCAFNSGMSGESSVGKTYVTLQVASFFPEQDVKIIGGASPTAFFHIDDPKTEEEKKKEKETKTKYTKIIDLEQKIVILLDMPSDELLRRIRPVLSHDKKEIPFKITDKNAKGSLRTKTAIIRGFASFILCSVGTSKDDQEKTRMFMLNPESDEDKIDQSLEMIALMQGDHERFNLMVKNDPKKRELTERTLAIKQAKINTIDVPTYSGVLNKFRDMASHRTPREMRDLPRLFDLIKGFALLNFRNRKIIVVGDIRKLIANDTDVKNGFQVYSKIMESNSLGLSPEQLTIYKTCVMPEMTDLGLDVEDIRQKFLEKYHRQLTEYRLKKDLIPSWKNAGLVYEEISPRDRRKTVIMALKDRKTTEPQKAEPMVEEDHWKW